MTSDFSRRIRRQVSRAAFESWLGFQRRFSRPRKERLLLVVPWLTMGGADKVNLDLVRGLCPRFDIFLVTTSDVHHGWESRFRPHVRAIIHAATLHWPGLQHVVIPQLVEGLSIKTILISNSREGYQALPNVKRRFPGVKVLDLLHGEGGALEMGGFPAISASYDAYLSRRIVISDHLVALLQHKYAVTREKIVRIHNGLDSDYFNPDALPVETSSRPLTISFIGRLSPEKHPEHVVSIARALSPAIQCQFLIAGDGPLRSELAGNVESAPPSHPLRFLGDVRDVRTLLGATDVLVLCSEMEGIPLVLLEAMSMRVPVVASRVGGIPEIVEDGVQGFLVPYDDQFVNEMTHALTTLLTDTALRHEFGRSGRERVLKSFSMHNMIAAYTTVLS